MENRRISRRTLLSRGAQLAGGVAAGSLIGPGLDRPPWTLSSARVASSKSTGSITIAVFEVIDTLDPGGTGLISTYQVLANMFDPLIWYLPGHGPSDYYPGLAQSYSISSDAKTYTFKLRRDVVFHDGTPFDATAVKATFDHVVSPATHSKSAIGAIGPYKETRIIDPYTVQVVFSQPNAAFLNEMSSPPLCISSPKALAKYGSDYGHHPVGTGPFMLKNWVQGEVVELTRNPSYA